MGITHLEVRTAFCLCLGGLAVMAASALYPLQTLLAVLGLSFAAIVIIRPVVGLYILLALFLLQSSPLYQSYGVLAGGSATIADVLALAVLASYLAQWILGRRRESSTLLRPRGGTAVLLVAAFCVWQIVSTTWSPAASSDIADTIRQTAEVAILFAMVVMMLQTKQQAQHSAAAYAITGFALALYTIATYRSYTGLGASAAFRGGLPASFNANDMAVIVALVPPFTFLAVGSRSVRVRLLLTMATVPPVVAALVILSSRGALIGFAVGLLASAALSRGYRYRLVVAGILVVGLGVIAYGLSTDTLPAYFEQRVAAAQYDQIGGRQPAWQAALDLFTQHPITGIGAGGFEVQVHALHIFTLRSTSAHSDYIETLANTGLVGFLLFVAILATVAKTAIVDSQRNPGTTMVVFTMLVVMSVGSFLLIHWFLPALAVVYCLGLTIRREVSVPATSDARSTEQGRGRWNGRRLLSASGAKGS